MTRRLLVLDGNFPTVDFNEFCAAKIREAKCELCRHWGAIEGTIQLADCARIKDGPSPDYRAQHETFVWRSWGADGRLKTRPDFGCVMFDGKP